MLLLLLLLLLLTLKMSVFFFNFVQHRVKERTDGITIMALDKDLLRDEIFEIKKSLPGPAAPPAGAGKK